VTNTVKVSCRKLPCVCILGECLPGTHVNDLENGRFPNSSLLLLVVVCQDSARKKGVAKRDLTAE